KSQAGWRRRDRRGGKNLGGRGQVRVVVDEDLVAGICGGIKTPALRIRRTALRQHIAGGIPGDEGRGSGQGDADQPRRLAAELGEEEIEADLVEDVGLLDDLAGGDVLLEDVGELLEPVAASSSFCQLQVVVATR